MARAHAGTAAPLARARPERLHRVQPVRGWYAAAGDVESDLLGVDAAVAHRAIRHHRPALPSLAVLHEPAVHDLRQPRFPICHDPCGSNFGLALDDGRVPALAPLLGNDVA